MNTSNKIKKHIITYYETDCQLDDMFRFLNSHFTKNKTVKTPNCNFRGKTVKEGVITGNTKGLIKLTILVPRPNALCILK